MNDLQYDQRMAECPVSLSMMRDFYNSIVWQLWDRILSMNLFTGPFFSPSPAFPSYSNAWSWYWYNSQVLWCDLCPATDLQWPPTSDWFERLMSRFMEWAGGLQNIQSMSASPSSHTPCFSWQHGCNHGCVTYQAGSWMNCMASRCSALMKLRTLDLQREWL